MANIDTTQAAKVLAGMLGVANFPTSAVNPMWVRLCTSTPAGATTGAELGGSGYTAGGQSGNWSAVAAGVPPTSTGPTAAAGLSWTAGANWSGTTGIQGFELWDNAGSKLRWWYGTFTGSPVQVNSGQVLQIAQSAIVVTLG